MEYHPYKNQILYFILTTLIVIFSVAKLANVTADFPSGVTWSGVLYTDEGWYTNAATSAISIKKAYKEKDFNPVVNMPLSYFLQYLSFKVLGKSLWSARLTSILFTFLTTLIVYLLVSRHSNTSTGLLASLLYSTHFIVFSFSRLAIVEPIYIFFSFSSLLFSLYSRTQASIRLLIISAFLAGLGILTKPTTIFIIPAILFLLITENIGVRDRIARISVFLSIFFFTWGSWYIFAYTIFNNDFTYFNELNVSSRSSFVVADILRRLLLTFDIFIKTEPYLCLLLVPLIFILVIHCQVFRRNSLVQAFGISFVSYFFILSTMSYRPPRYLLPLTHILILLVPLCIFYFRNSVKTGTPLLILFVLVYVLHSGYLISNYIAHPKYSFVSMMKDVGNLISEDGNYKERRIIGRITDSIALEENIYPLNSGLSPYPLDERLSMYRPKYYIGFRKEAFEKFMQRSQLISELEFVAEWDVFDNYYYDWGPLHLYRIHYEK